jgi:hypothetical protein
VTGDSVTVAIASIPPRRGDLLPEAIGSVYAQDHPVDALAVATDVCREGAWATRQRALDMVRTDWVAFLDDDDLLYPQHVRRLLETARAEAADYVFSYFDRRHTTDVLRTFGRPFDPARPYPTTITVLVRTELAQSVGFSAPDPRDEAGGEDWRFTLGCVQAGAHVVHLPEETWHWRHWGHNTSGRPDRW